MNIVLDKLRNWITAADPLLAMSGVIFVLLVAGGLTGALCLTVCSHLAGHLQLMFAGLIAFGCLAIWLTAALVRDTSGARS